MFKVRVGQFVKLDCYIQEYRNDADGRLNARLREKHTDKHVVLVTPDPALKGQLLVFLSQAKAHKDIMPTVFDKDGTDIVAVRGICVEETDTSIDVNPYVQNGGFLFE